MVCGVIVPFVNRRSEVAQERVAFGNPGCGKVALSAVDKILNRY